MYVDAGDSIPPTSTRCRVPAVQGFSGKYRSPGEDDFPENRLRHDLAQPTKTRTTFVGGNGTPGLLHTVHVHSLMR